MRTGMDSVFGLHHFAHAHNAETRQGLARRHGRPIDEGRQWILTWTPATRRVPRRGAGLARGATCRRNRCRPWTPTRASSRTGSGSTRSREARLSTVTWPREFGGRDASLLQWVVFEDEYYAAGAPARVSANGIALLGSTLLAFGTDEQKHRILPRMSRADDIWAQAWSEPEAGSDLAARAQQGRRAPTAAGSSVDRRRGARGRATPTARSGCSAAIPTPSGTAGSRTSCSTCGPRASPSGRSRSSTACPASRRSSSTTCSCRTRT